MTRSFTALALFCALAASPVLAQDLSKLGFMTGHWVQKTDREEVQETWLGPRGNTMVATNLTLTAGRGPTFEFMRIGVRDGKVVFFASPSGRPPVEFPAREIGDGSVVFENPANAYPTRIMYRRDGDALIARIEGKRQGADASEEWRFTRAP
jgi:hypothetical protein